MLCLFLKIQIEISHDFQYNAHFFTLCCPFQFAFQSLHMKNSFQFFSSQILPVNGQKLLKQKDLGHIMYEMGFYLIYQI